MIILPHHNNYYNIVILLCLKIIPMEAKMKIILRITNMQ